MQPIHQGLKNRDIMEGSASDYGLVKVTTCKVSGQLATDACKHDVMGYGTTTDYFPKESAPTVSCQMHYALNVCQDSGLLAGPYCPSTESKGVVILPMGHPLYGYIGTSYEGVLSDYLGEYATLKLTADGNANAALLNSISCTLHQADGSTFENTLMNNYLLPDAQRLLSQARNQLAGLDPGHLGYASLQSAIDHLDSVLLSNPSSDLLAAAMSTLTMAMAGAQ